MSEPPSLEPKPWVGDEAATGAPPEEQVRDTEPPPAHDALAEEMAQAELETALAHLEDAEPPLQHSLSAAANADSLAIEADHGAARAHNMVSAARDALEQGRLLHGQVSATLHWMEEARRRALAMRDALERTLEDVRSKWGAIHEARNEAERAAREAADHQHAADAAAQAAAGAADHVV